MIDAKTQITIPAVVRWHGSFGKGANARDENRHGILVKRTPSKVYVILCEDHVHVRKLPEDEMMHMALIDQPVWRAKNILRAHGRKFTISKEARELLKR